MGQNKYQQILPKVALDKGVISAVPIGGHFKYLGRTFNFDMKDEIPKKEVEEKIGKLLQTVTDLNIKPQTKLKIFSIFVPTQIIFDIKIYSFAPTFISSVIDRLCTAYIRKWLEYPVSSCVIEWMSSPTKFCGLNIPTFANRAERLLLTKRNALMSSKNTAVREYGQRLPVQIQELMICCANLVMKAPQNNLGMNKPKLQCLISLG